MVEEQKKEEIKETVSSVQDKGKKKFPVRLVLMYALLLAGGLFLGIIFSYVLR